MPKPDVEYFIFYPLLTNFYLGSREFVGGYKDELDRTPILINSSPRPLSALRYLRSEKMLREINYYVHKI